MNWDEAQVTDLGWGGVGDSRLNDAWNAVQYTQGNVEEPGFIHEVKDAFAKFDYGGRFVKWLDEMPYGEVLQEISEIKRVRGKYAVVCGRFPTKDSTWEVRTIWINNPVLQAVLLDVFKGHPDVRCGSEVLEFKAPFAPLIHRWEQLCKLAGDNVGSEIQELMKLFVDMLKEELQDTLIRVKKKSKRLGVQLMETSTYATVNSTFHVPFFHGAQPLSELSVRPIWACPENDIKTMKAALVKRGRKYEGLRGIHLRFHQGQGQSQADTPQGYQESSSNHGACIPIAEINWEATAPGWESEDEAPANFKSTLCKTGPNNPKETRLPIQATEGRVIVDAVGPGDGCGFPHVGPLQSLDLTGVLNANGNDSKASTSGKHQEAQESSVPQNKERDDPDRLTDDEAMLTVSIVNCFSLERKVLCYAEIESLAEIEWNTQALNNLVVDEEEKRLLVGFVGATKNGQLQHFDDFVHGKGKGLVMLLCGPPGTGKTFTAESVSENLKRPLYRLDSSDLGMDPTKLEGNLKAALDLCARWDAILLLDEADVFLEKRSSSNLTQNEMTTIFLRLLEYYKGVMILTTNRYPAIDPAFESRIDLSFVFQDLEPASRGKIWYNFLIKENKALADDSNAIAKLASMPLNGRQIKSAVKTARILAASENLPLAVDHLQTVVFMRMKALKMLE
ncbi:P-loop containing protein [Fusarium mexicanum]|uniref:P-loop containing protein n=1 Tax=Fusarium mexicanum TaxID=751941 RepID=A0A8H5MRC9_9HYPO|nr:P-loop containing protein [Fusarium mexicanum]